MHGIRNCWQAIAPQAHQETGMLHLHNTHNRAQLTQVGASLVCSLLGKGLSQTQEGVAQSWSFVEQAVVYLLPFLFRPSPFQTLKTLLVIQLIEQGSLRQ